MPVIPPSFVVHYDIIAYLRLDNVGLTLEELPGIELSIGITIDLPLLPKLSAAIVAYSLKLIIGVIVFISLTIWFIYFVSKS